MADSTSNIITWAKISQILSEKDIRVSNATGGGKLDVRHPRLIRMERKSLEYLYAQDPYNQYLLLISNYVLSLCGKYLFQAKQISGLGTGGIVTNPNPGIIVNPNAGNVGAILKAIDEEYIIGSAGCPIPVGATSYVLNYSNIINKSVTVTTPQSNLPQGQSNQFSYTVIYLANSATVNFQNSDGLGNNIGVQSGMTIMIRGYYLTPVTAGVAPTGAASVFPKTKYINGSQIINNVYSDADYRGYALNVFLNGVRYLKPTIEYDDTLAGGGFTLIGLTLGGTDDLVIIPNYLR